MNSPALTFFLTDPLLELTSIGWVDAGGQRPTDTTMTTMANIAHKERYESKMISVLCTLAAESFQNL